MSNPLEVSNFLEWGETYIRKSRIISITVEKKEMLYREYNWRECYSDVELKRIDFVRNMYKRLEVLRDQVAKRREDEFCEVFKKIYAGDPWRLRLGDYECSDKTIKGCLKAVSCQYPKVMTEYKRAIEVILWWRRIVAWYKRKIKPYRDRYRVALAVDEPQEECNVSIYYGAWGAENEVRQEAKKLAQDI